MKQPQKKTTPKRQVKRKTTPQRTSRPHPKYGTSKLEERFAKDFLDKLGVKYVRQFEAKDIGRFYDFYVTDANCLIEVDGDFFHGFGLLHEDKSPMQKHNEWVDKQKDMWAASHCIPLLRIWEHDINEHPEKVRKMLTEYIGKSTDKKNKSDGKKKRH